MTREISIPVWKPHTSFHPGNSISGRGGRDGNQTVIVEARPETFHAVSYHSRILNLQPETDTGFKPGQGYETHLELVDVKTVIFKYEIRYGVYEYRKLDVPSFIMEGLKIFSGGDRTPAPIPKTWLKPLTQDDLSKITYPGRNSDLDPQKTTDWKAHAIGNDWRYTSGHVVNEPYVAFQDVKNAKLISKGIKPLEMIREGTQGDDFIAAELGSQIRTRGGDDIIKLYSHKRFWNWKEILTKINGGEGTDTLELNEIGGLLEVSRSKSGKCFLITERFRLENTTSGNQESIYKYKLYSIEKLKITDTKENIHTYDLDRIGAGEKKFFEDGKWYIPDSSAPAKETISNTDNSDQSICAPELLDPVTGQ